MMRRVGLLAVLLVVAVGVALFASGVIRVEVRPPATDRVSASPFWREVEGEPRLPPALTVWVELAKTVTPAVVNVSTRQRSPVHGPLSDPFFRHFFGGPPPGAEERQSLGSGVIASPDGYIVTNDHVVRNAAEIVVRLADQREHRARLVGTDPKVDVALLKIDATSLPTLPFGNSDRLQVGEPVMAIGNPFGLAQTVTTGIVSAKERFIGSGPYDDYIQTDASINPGNSGGPLVDAQGALVGINTAIFSPTGGSIGIGFAIPVNLAKESLAQLRAHGKVVRGYLGVAVGPVTEDAQKSAGLSAPRGALVAEVTPRSPAAAAGFKPGDVITAFQGQPVQNPHGLTRRVAGTPPGTHARVEIVRSGKTETVTPTLGELPERGGNR